MFPMVVGLASRLDGKDYVIGCRGQVEKKQYHKEIL